ARLANSPLLAAPRFAHPSACRGQRGGEMNDDTPYLKTVNQGASMDQNQDKKPSPPAGGGFWVNLVRAEMVVQVVGLVVIGVVAVTAIIVFGMK
ncbi:hypothetical protein, partial [Acidovorax sp. Root217]|uniref:hypothetical protein n=1 Tax=Acidovorax sp. Root217 TaxID=1736492 RepID=UPI001F342E56